MGWLKLAGLVVLFFGIYDVVVGLPYHRFSLRVRK